MTIRTLSWLLLVAAGGMAPTAAPQKATAARSGRVVLLSVDAGADWIVDELVGRGKAPAFAAIAREGAMAEAMTTVLPTLTAPAHASL